VTPALAALLGWWILDERLTPTQLGGVVVILAGVTMVNWPRASNA
jgi:drug/metabolite transporter (DMT)-like permease